MCEWVMIGALIVAAYKIADMDERSGLIWAVVAFGIAFGSLFLIPLPFIRILVAGVAVIVVMVIAKMIEARPAKAAKRRR